MPTKRILALSVLVLVPTALVATRHAGLPAGPDRLHAGDAVPASLVRYATAAHLAAATDTVDVAFVARSCAVCQAMVRSFVDAMAHPKPGHELLLLTDRVWPALDSLARQGVHVAPLTDKLATAIGVRATPTLVSYSVRTSVAFDVEVGSQAVERTITRLR